MHLSIRLVITWFPIVRPAVTGSNLCSENPLRHASLYSSTVWFRYCLTSSSVTLVPDAAPAPDMARARQEAELTWGGSGQLRYHANSLGESTARYFPANKPKWLRLRARCLSAAATLFLQAWGLNAFAPPLGSCEPPGTPQATLISIRSETCIMMRRVLSPHANLHGYVTGPRTLGQPRYHSLPNP